MVKHDIDHLGWKPRHTCKCFRSKRRMLLYDAELGVIEGAWLLQNRNRHLCFSDIHQRVFTLPTTEATPMQNAVEPVRSTHPIKLRVIQGAGVGHSQRRIRLRQPARQGRHERYDATHQRHELIAMRTKSIDFFALNLRIRS